MYTVHKRKRIYVKRSNLEFKTVRRWHVGERNTATNSNYILNHHFYNVIRRKGKLYLFTRRKPLDCSVPKGNPIILQRGTSCDFSSEGKVPKESMQEYRRVLFIDAFCIVSFINNDKDVLSDSYYDSNVFRRTNVKWQAVRAGDTAVICVLHGWIRRLIGEERNYQYRVALNACSRLIPLTIGESISITLSVDT